MGGSLDRVPWLGSGIDSLELDHPATSVRLIIPHSSDMVMSQNVKVMFQLDWAVGVLLAYQLHQLGPFTDEGRVNIPTITKMVCNFSTELRKAVSLRPTMA